MKVTVAMNNGRGNLGMGSVTVEAESTMAGLLEVLRGVEAKTFKEMGYITARAWCADGTGVSEPATVEVKA